MFRSHFPLFAVAVSMANLTFGEIRHNPGSTEPLAHDRYVRVVAEKDSPVERLYVKTRDGLYVAAALRKPKGVGPFPVLIHFHGAPGGRGMDQLVGWALGATGGPMWERFLQEGYVVVVADYRGGSFPRGQGLKPEEISYADDGIAILDHIRSLPYVDRNRISLYGVSLGGDVVLHMLSRTEVHSAILGERPSISLGRQHNQFNQELARKNDGEILRSMKIWLNATSPQSKRRF